jgi:hypothetical protein
MAPSLDGPGAGPPQALGPFLWFMESRLLVGCRGIPKMMAEQDEGEECKGVLG